MGRGAYLDRKFGLTHPFSVVCERDWRSRSERVLVGDALPDARRGLCPLDASILEETRRRGQVPTRAYRKSSALIDDLDVPAAAAWERIVTLAQDFVTRYPLIDGQGNFGSIDSDPPADPVYTECRLTHAGLAAVDGAWFPSLLVNGAVGSRTVIPPHNLEGVARAVSEMLRDPGAPVDRLAELIGGPDFATGGVVTEGDPLAQIYSTGRGRLVLEARTHRAGRDLVITELPYGVSKGGDDGVIQTIADLVRDRELPAVADLRDESNRDGMRLIVTPESQD